MIIKKKLLYVGLAGWMLLSGITLVGCRKNGIILETTEQNTGSQNDTAYAEDAVVGSVKGSGRHRSHNRHRSYKRHRNLCICLWGSKTRRGI